MPGDGPLATCTLPVGMFYLLTYLLILPAPWNYWKTKQVNVRDSESSDSESRLPGVPCPAGLNPSKDPGFQGPGVELCAGTWERPTSHLYKLKLSSPRTRASEYSVLVLTEGCGAPVL
jgi:hypothetical protein